jgi:hypothetical protein
MKNGFFPLSLSGYYYVNLYASFDIKDNTDMIKFKQFKTDSPRNRGLASTRHLFPAKHTNSLVTRL